MHITVFELISLDVTVGSPFRLSIDELVAEGSTALALSAVCRCRHRPAVQARGLRLLSLATSRAGERDREDRDELLALAVATRNAVRNMRNAYQTLLHQSSQALARLEDDEEVELIPRLRLAVRQLLVEREILANLLNSHPNLRQEAGQLRISADETFPEESSGEDEP